MSMKFSFHPLNLAWFILVENLLSQTEVNLTDLAKDYKLAGEDENEFRARVRTSEL